MILKFQQGGTSVPPLTSYVPVMNIPTQNLSSASRTTEKKAEQGLGSEDIYKLIDQADLLPNDVEIIKRQLQQFVINQEYSLQPTQIANQYLNIVSQIKQGKFRKEHYDEVFKTLTENGGLNEIAIDSRGLLICKNSENEYQFLQFKDFINQSEYTPVTNAYLLKAGANDLSLALSENIFTAASGGVGMKAVNEALEKILNQLGKDSKSEEGYINTQMKSIIKGIDDLKQALSTNLEFDPTLQNLYKYKILNENQIKQVQSAFNYIMMSLPENMKTLLQYKARNLEGGMATLLTQLIGSKVSSKSEFTIDLDKPSITKGSSGNGNSSLGGLDMNPVSMLEAGYAQQDMIVIQTPEGGTRGLQVPTLKMPIIDKSGNPVGVSTLVDIAKSGFAGYLDFNNVTMGDGLISQFALDNVVVDGTALHTAYLPVDLEEYNATGNIRPDIGMLARYKEAQTELKEAGITDKEQINKVYQKHGLPIIFDGNGDITTSYIKFGMINAAALDKAFTTDVSLSSYLTETTDENDVNNILYKLQQGRSEKDRLDFDSQSWWDAFWGSSNYDHIYKGVVFIPVNQNHFTATAGTGDYATTTEAEFIEGLLQGRERSKQLAEAYVNPGKL